VDRNVDKRGTRAAAEAYLRYFYTEEAQDIIAKHGFRPRSALAARKYKQRFQNVELFTIEQVSGGWRAAQKKHFDDGGVFDQIYGASS
jgi:sulfate transport system substrate-binding protein